MDHQTVYRCTGTCGGVSPVSKNCGAKECIKYNQPLTKVDWRKELTPEQYKVLRECGTEAPFTGAYWNSKEKGMYLCAACGNELFSSDAKYDSGSGWPSFWKPVNKENVAHLKDASHEMSRTEVKCSRCGGHLGHAFEDGPKPTGQRYCINSAALKFSGGKTKKSD